MTDKKTAIEQIKIENKKRPAEDLRVILEINTVIVGMIRLTKKLDQLIERIAEIQAAYNSREDGKK